MKLAAFIGIALIKLGILSFAYQDNTCTDGEKFVALCALLSGFVLLVVNSNKALHYASKDDAVIK